jgi:Glycosyl transferases group 1
MSRPVRILGCWAASDFDEFFQPAFGSRPDFQIEVVSGDRTSGPSPHSIGLKQLSALQRRLRAGEFDLILSGNIWNTPWPPHKGIWTSLAVAARFYTYKRRMLDTHWAPRLARSTNGQVPMAAIDLRDSPFVLPWDWPLLRDSTLYFKRELFFMPNRSLLPLQISHGKKQIARQESKLRPLTYGVRPSHLERPSRPMTERDIDIFMSGGDNSIRTELKARCRKLRSRYRVEVVDGFLNETDYDEMLQRAKLVVCTESFGCETWRQYEVAAAGAVPLINWPFAQNYMPFEPDKHAIYFSLIGEDFERRAEQALLQPDRLQEISTTTRDFVRKYKDRRVIGDYIIRTTLDFAAQQSGIGRK